MSAFLGFESYLVDAGATPLQIRDELVNRFTNRNWQVLRKGRDYASAIPGTMVHSGYPITSMFDDNKATVCYCDEDAGPWHFGVQMASPVVISKFEMTAADYAEYRSPKDFTLQWSDDGTNWTVADTWTGVVGWSDGDTQTFTVTGNPGAHIYWRMHITAKQTDSNGFALRRWMPFTSADEGIASVCWFDTIPFASEPIGDGKLRGFSRISIASTEINLQVFDEAVANVFPQMHSIIEEDAGAVTPSVTIGGITVSASAGTVNAANTSQDNLRFLYNALRLSTDPNFTDWDYELILLPPGTAEGKSEILMKRKVFSRTLVAITTNANVTSASRMTPVLDGDRAVVGVGFNIANTAFSVTIDRVAGFVYYLSMFTRTFSLATKTAANYYGPVGATYLDNTIARAMTPDSPMCSPMELWMFNMGMGRAAADTRFAVQPTHVWGIGLTSGHNKLWYGTNPGGMGHPLGQGYILRTLQDRSSFLNPGWDNLLLYHITDCYGTALGMNRVTDNSLLDDYSVVGTAFMGLQTVPTYTDVFVAVPAFVFEDLYKRQKVSTNETLVIAFNNSKKTTLTTAILTGDTPTVIEVASTDDFAAAGAAVCNGEAFIYTGKTATTLTGVTRSSFGSSKTDSFVGDKVHPGHWFVTIGDAQMYAGTVKPS